MHSQRYRGSRKEIEAGNSVTDDCCSFQVDEVLEELQRGDSEQLHRLRGMIEQTYGLVYDGPDSGLLSQAIADRMQATGIRSLASYCSFVLSSPVGAGELRLLVDAATVKETRFFRGKGLFDALLNDIVPDIMSRIKPASQGGRSVRAWSAGCATGEEAYSLALVLIESALGRYLSPVRVVGTDVSVSALAHATGGVYFAGALRNVDRNLLKRYFIELPADDEPADRTGPGLWSVRHRVGPQLAACVEFFEHNLAAIPYPARLREFDLILCRNVLMYFSIDTAARVMRELTRCLCEGGYLVLDSLIGPLDLESDECRVVHSEHGVVIEKIGKRRLHTQARTNAHDRSQSRTQASVSIQPLERADVCRAAVTRTARVFASQGAEQAHIEGGQPRLQPRQPQETQQPQEPRRPQELQQPQEPQQSQQRAGSVHLSSDDRIEEAKAAADRGDYEHALSLLDSLRQETPFDTRVHRLMGEIHLQLSDPRAASYCFTRLLYLDPSDAVAHWRMADACEQMGKHDNELRHLFSALRCLEDSGSRQHLELPSDVLVRACLHRIERLRLRQRT